MKHLTTLLVFFSILHLAKGQETQSLTKALPEKSIEIQNQQTDIDGISIFYREAGPKDAPTILMLHGFPSSSHMYRNLITNLSNEYHVIAPDYPGFGFSDVPSVEDFEYSFDNIANVIEKFTTKVVGNNFYLLMHDYGGPIGMRIATKNPNNIKGLVILNANSYMEGLGEWSIKIGGYVQNKQFEELEKFKNYLISSEGIKEQYITGANNPVNIDPISYLTDNAFFDRKNVRDVQSVLFNNYGSNFPKYPEWQNYLKTQQPKTLVLWGENDKFFSKAGGDAYRNDLKDVEIHFYDTGHFLLEEFLSDATNRIRIFLEQNEKNQLLTQN